MMFAQMNVNWHLVPLIVAVTLVYSATRFETWPYIFSHAIRWALYILGFLGVTYLFLLPLALDASLWWYVPLGIATLYYSLRPGRRKENKTPST